MPFYLTPRKSPHKAFDKFSIPKKSKVGILRIEYCEAVRGFSSTLSFAILTRPAYSEASCSRIGDTIWQGPHHGAQQSTIIAPGYESTSMLNVLSVTVTGRS